MKSLVSVRGIHNLYSSVSLSFDNNCYRQKWNNHNQKQHVDHCRSAFVSIIISVHHITQERQQQSQAQAQSQLK